MAQTVKRLSAVQETQVQSLGQEDPVEKGMSTHSGILPEEFHGWRRLEFYTVHGVAKSRTRLSD